MVEKGSFVDDIKPEVVEKFRVFLNEKYKKELHKAAQNEEALIVDFDKLDKFMGDLSQYLVEKPDQFLKVAETAVEGIDLPGPVKIRFFNLPESNIVKIRDLRSKHLGKFTSVEGIVRRSSEIRPEIVAVDWKCLDCGMIVRSPVKATFVSKPFRCINVVDGKACTGKSFIESDKVMIDTRWITVEEPFELTEGEKPSQVNIWLTEDLVSPEGRRMTDPGNRMKFSGILRDVPKGKIGTVKLDFFLEANHVEPTETSWEKLLVNEEDKKVIKAMAKDPDIYEKLVDSMAPSLYGLREIKESIIMQLFGGCARVLPDGTEFRGDIHILIIGDPSAGKSQLLKLVPKIVPRGRYVSGKGVTGAGLCMSYDTLIPFAHGEIKQIGDVVEEALLKEKKKIDGGFISSRGDMEVVTLNKDLRIKKRPVTKYFKLKPADKLVEIRTNSGRKIKVTKENPLLTTNNGDIVWRNAQEFKNGDYIALARNLPVNHLPVNMNAEFARFMGMVAGDGDVGNREVRFHNTNEEFLDEFHSISNILGFNPRKYYQKNRISCVRVASKKLCDTLEDNAIPRGVKCDKIVIPPEVLKSDELTIEFLSSLFTCNGGPVEKQSGSYVEFTTTSNTLAKQVQTTLLRFGVLSKLREREPSSSGFGGKKKKYAVLIRGQENLQNFNERIGFKHEKGEKMQAIINRNIKSNTNVDIIPGLGEKIRKVRKELGITIKNDKDLYLLRHYESGERLFSRRQLLRFADLLKSKKDHPYFDQLKMIAESDIFWDKIVEIKNVSEDWVYDLTVDNEHNFLANDIIVHNTATVTKDEQFMGGWVLEAGALVLTNKGLLAIDEFEKMDTDDQVAMHEALEQGCYEYGTMVMTQDGNYERIGDVVEKHIAGIPGERIAKPVDKRKLKLMSTDFKKNFFDGVTVVGKHKEKELIEIRLSTGHEIKITKKHPVFVFEMGEVKLKEAKDVKKNDCLLLHDEIKFKGKSQVLPAIKTKKKYRPVSVPTKTTKEFCEFIGYFLGEGNRELNRGVANGIGFTNSDKSILNRYRQLLRKLFKIKYIEQKKGNRITVSVTSRPMYLFLENLGEDMCKRSWEKAIPKILFKCPEKETNALLSGLFNSEGTVNCPYGTVSITTTSKVLAEQVQHLLLRAGIFSGLYNDNSLHKRKRPAFKVQISGKSNIIRFSKKIGFIDKRNKVHLKRLQDKQTKSSKWEHIPGIMENVENVKNILRLSDKNISGYILTNVRKRNSVSKSLLRKIINSFDKRIEKLAIARESIKKAKTYSQYRKIRESIGISRSEIARFIGISQQNLWYEKAVKHNRKLEKKSHAATEKILKEMTESGKKGVKELRKILEMPFEFTSVKGVKRVKNNKGWVYDVTVNPTQTFMANGIVCHNSISIAKASIVATLPAKTSVLAGGNPKFSRFDPMRSITEQIDIPPTLLSRFDLKFTLRDVPNAKIDKKIVEHVLQSRHEAEKNAPVIEPDMIRKFVAYSKENCFPVMGPDVSKQLKNFYVKTRGRAEGGKAPVPISLRQFEALLRIAEASAKIRLSNVITKDDANRAIKLMKASLKDLGSDIETGEIDIDKSEGGTPFSERSKITKILGIIDDLSGDKRDIVLISKIKEIAAKDEMSSQEVDDLVDRLKREGILFEPNPGYVQRP